MYKQKLLILLVDKFFISGLLFFAQYIVFVTIDFIVYGGLCLHHIPEVVGCLFLGFWLAHHFSWWVAPFIYIIKLFWSELFFRHSITLDGIVASAIVTITLLIGDWTERCRLEYKNH